MHIVECLLETAVEDNQLLIRNQELGDRPEVPRDIDFVLYAKNQERAELIASFVTDNHYGQPSVERVEYKGTATWQLLITINAPTTEHVIMPISAFMVFLAQLYDLEYDGWSSMIQK